MACYSRKGQHTFGEQALHDKTPGHRVFEQWGEITLAIYLAHWWERSLGPQRASFAPLLVELKQHGPQDVLHRVFQENFCEAVFASGFIKELNTMNVEDGNPTELVKMCEDLLRQCRQQDDLCNATDGAKVVVQNVQKAVRGIHCLVAPIPWQRDTAFDDVAYVSPKNASTAPIIADIPKIGRLLVSRFRSEVLGVLMGCP